MRGYGMTAGILKAVAHPVRIRILEVLEQEGEACVCHLESRLDQRQAYISQQLAKLREAGLVDDRRDGLNVFYSLSLEEVEPLLDAAKELGLAAGRAGGFELEFSGLLGIDPVNCQCPSCQESLAVGVAR